MKACLFILTFAFSKPIVTNNDYAFDDYDDAVSDLDSIGVKGTETIDK